MDEKTAEAYAKKAAQVEMPHGVSTIVKELSGEELPRVPSLRTMRRYMIVLGFRWEHWRKSKYFDGHDRENVVRYRQESFIPQLEGLRPNIIEWRSPTEPDTKSDHGSPKFVLVFHDECVFHANDGKN